MSYIDAIVLGLIQGVTEFLPISSSGHLVIMSHLLGIKGAFTFDTMLNFGTIGALLVFYRKRIWLIIVRALKGKEWLFLAKVLLACIPAAFVGLALGTEIEKLNELVWVVIVMQIIVGVLMIRYGTARPDADDRPIEQSVGWKTALKVGLAQSIALIPGTSRSGITILTSLQSRLSAARAAEFSFLLSIPIVLAASLKVLFLDSGLTYTQENTGPVIAGITAAFLSGLLAISFFIKLLATRGLKDFGWYRIGMGILLAALLITGII